MNKNRKHETLFKLKLVNEYLQGGSITGISKKWKVSKSLLTRWVDRYNSQGNQGLSTRLHHHHSNSFKLKVVKDYQTKGLSLRACCIRYDIATESTVLSWLRKYEANGLDGLREQRGRPKIMKKDKPSSKKAKPLTRLEELEKENLYLRAENELLKKLEALDQQKEAQKKKR
jgi:transposase